MMSKNDRLKPVEIPALTIEQRVAIKQFYTAVCQRAEDNMRVTHRLEGMHYAALVAIMVEWGLMDLGD